MIWHCFHVLSFKNTTRLSRKLYEVAQRHQKPTEFPVIRELHSVDEMDSETNIQWLASIAE